MFIQAISLATGEIAFLEEINVLERNPKHSISNMKVFNNILYLELSLSESDSENYGPCDSQAGALTQYKVYAFLVD